MPEIVARVRRGVPNAHEPGDNRWKQTGREHRHRASGALPPPGEQGPQGNRAEKRHAGDPDVERAHREGASAEPRAIHAVPIVAMVDRALEDRERESSQGGERQIGEETMGIGLGGVVETDAPDRGCRRPAGHGGVPPADEPDAGQEPAASEPGERLHRHVASVRDEVERNQQCGEAGGIPQMEGRPRLDQVDVSTTRGEGLGQRVVPGVVTAGEEVRIEGGQREEERDGRAGRGPGARPPVPRRGILLRAVGSVARGRLSGGFHGDQSYRSAGGRANAPRRGADASPSITRARSHRETRNGRRPETGQRPRASKGEGVEGYFSSSTTS